jgi:hypothetical protein
VLHDRLFLQVQDKQRSFAHCMHASTATVKFSTAVLAAKLLFVLATKRNASYAAGPTLAVQGLLA